MSSVLLNPRFLSGQPTVGKFACWENNHAPGRRRRTFKEVLVSVAPHNLQILENKARTASLLARDCPENEVVFREMEAQAVRQMYRILARGSQMRARRTIHARAVPQSV